MEKDFVTRAALRPQGALRFGRTTEVFSFSPTTMYTQPPIRQSNKGPLWFRKTDRCHTCALRWTRGQDGFETGAITMNIIVTFGLMTIVFIVVTVAVPTPPSSSKTLTSTW